MSTHTLTNPYGVVIVVPVGAIMQSAMAVKK